MSKPDPVDVLVIGAGASGTVCSLVLAQAGLRVVRLDQGGWTEPAQHPHYSDGFQYQRQNRWNPEPSIRRGPDDYPVEGGQSHALMWNGVGGSTNVFAALWPRFRPSDFRKGREHGLAPDWPITYEDLAPFYDEADRLVGVSGLTGDAAMPPRALYPLGPMPMRKSGRDAWFARRFGHSFGAYAIGDGLPAAKLHYVPHENNLRMMRYGIERLRDLAQSVDAFDTMVNDYMEDGVYRTPAWHMLGTCRMESDPGTSVVNQWHQSWEVPNL